MYRNLHPARMNIGEVVQSCKYIVINNNGKYLAIDQLLKQFNYAGRHVETAVMSSIRNT